MHGRWEELYDSDDTESHDDDNYDDDDDEHLLKVTQGEALQPPLPADLGLLGITATVQALGRPIAEGVGHRDADPRSAVLRHSKQDHGLEEAGHVSGAALQPPRPAGQEILDITANVQALGRLLDEGEGPWHADASQGALRHSHHGIGPQSGSLIVDQPECSAVQGQAHVSAGRDCTQDRPHLHCNELNDLSGAWKVLGDYSRITASQRLHARR